MNIIKRAVINIIRQPIKSLSLLLLITVLGGLLLGGLSMSRAMIATEERLLMQIPAVATLIYNGDEISGWDQPTREEIMSVGNLPYVRVYDFTLQTFFYSQELSWIDGMDPGLFTGRGVNNPNITDIESGLISLFEGRTFTQEEIDNDAMVMVIPRSIATVNHLTVGSRINIANIAHDFRWWGDWSDRFNEEFVLAKRMLEFEVIGIFTPEEYEDEEGSYFRDPILFYMPFGVAESMLNFEINAMIEADEEEFRGLGQGFLQEELLLETLFVLYSPRDLDMFFEASMALLPEDWRPAGIDEAIFTPITVSMDMVLELANTIQIAVIFASILVLTLVLLLFLRDRRHEIGIYLALGDKKIKVMLQILIEVGIIAIVGLVLAIFMGYLFSHFMTGYLFEQHLTEQLAMPFFSTGVTPWELTLHIPGQMSVEEAMTLFDVALTPLMLLIFVAISILIIALSTLLPIFYVLKIEPKELLLEQ